jgi:membrane associated rhomboid family serine protease
LTPLTHGEAQAEPTATLEAPPWPSVLRRTYDSRRLDAWALVLLSRGVRSFAVLGEGGFELYVAPGDLARASAELDAADAEEQAAQRAFRDEAVREPRPAKRHAIAGGVLVASLLLAFFALTGPRAHGSVWFTAGAADAERVLHGEWWRAVTALTLHADGAHLASNLGIGALVVGAVMRSEGVGFGAALVLAAGTAGNVINAWAHQTLHSSVGFSTAVFGAIGLLGGLSYAYGTGRANRPRPAWTALAGSLALLALLGSSERSDLFAHLFGGVSGIGLGLLVGFRRWQPRTGIGQWFAGAGATAVIVGAWLVALAQG